MIVDLWRFLQTGKVGALAVGMCSERVLQLLGDPEDIGTGDSFKMTLWRMGPCEIIFEYGEITSIILDHGRELKSWKKVVLKKSRLRQLVKLRQDGAEDFFRMLRCNVVKIHFATSEEEDTIYSLESGVQVFFLYGRFRTASISKIYQSPDRHTNTECQPNLN